VTEGAIRDAIPARAKLSAFVIAYNRETIIGTCLRALRFADEVIVVDKGSTDATPAIAAGLADRVIRVPWTPTVEETRAFALSQCTHDWVLFLDDDECLSVAAVRFLDAELLAPRADIYALPSRHYVIGLHDERAHYWPEHQIRFCRRDSIAFTDTVHAGSRLLSKNIFVVPPESGVCIHHLSHSNVAQWIEKTNRYTSQPLRARAPGPDSGLAQYAHDRIDHWMGLTAACEPNAYPAAVAVLKALYDIVDRLKTWEEEAGLDGNALFQVTCARLDADYAAGLSDLARPRMDGSESRQESDSARIHEDKRRGAVARWFRRADTDRR
jgi:glycosyltransferase involved in cell wall biosynthesis